MKKKLVALFLTIVMVMLSVTPVWGAARSVKKALGYSNGIREWTLTSEYYTGGSNSSANQNSLEIKSGGEAEYFFYVPFHSVSVEFSFSSAGADFTLYDVMADKSYSVQTDGTSYTLNFAPTLYIGEHNFIIRADKEKDVNISEMVFKKNQILISEHDYEICNMTDEEWAVATAIILKEDASLIMVNGSRRYIDYNNPTLTPRRFNGSLYLPAHALARMLDGYIEELPDKKYVLIRKKDKEFLFAPDICYRQTFGKDREPIDNLVVYEDGYAWLPIRTIAEYFGEYVGYKNGYVAMDDNRFYVNDILEAGSVHSFVDSHFQPFIVSKDKDYTGRTYYVAQKAPNASDENVGDEAAPWKTLAHAGQVVKAGDTVIVKEGIYRETLKVKNNGEPNKPISFVAAQGEEVIISASEKFKGCFMPYKDGMLAAHVPWDLGPTKNQVYYNGETINEARHPNGPELEVSEQAGLSSNWPTMGDIHVDHPEDLYHAYSDTVLNQEEKDYWKGGYLMGVWATAYGVQATNIVASEKGKLTLEGGSLTAWGTTTDNATQYNYSWAYIAGHQNAIDMPGEWVIRGNTLFILPPEGETADTLELEIKKRMLVIDLQDNKHVSVSGFTTIGGSAKLGNSEMCRIDNCHVKYNNHYLYNADPSKGFIDDGIQTNPNGAPMRGELGFLIGGRDNVITNSHFDEAAGPALYVNGLYAYMENLLVEDCGYAGSYLGGIFVAKNAWEPYDKPNGGYYLYQSTCANAGRSVFMRMTTSDVRTPMVLPGHNAYNEYYGSMLTSLDSGIIYTYLTDHGFDRLKTQMHNNLAYTCYDGIDSFIFGIYHDGGTQNIDTYENVVFSTDESIKPGDDVHTAYAELALANCDVWNNTEEMTLGHDLIIPEGKAGLKPEHYPYNKPFYAGTKLFREPYLVNYELRHEDTTKSLDPNNMLIEKEDYILAKKAKTGEGAWIDENGRARFTKDGDWICFEDVDFGEGKNVVTISYQADPYYLEGEDFEIMVDGLDQKVYTMENYITADSRQPNIGEIRHRKISAYAGYHDVYIRAKDFFDAKITGIKVWEDDLASSMRLDNVTWAGNFDQEEYKVVVDGFASVPKESTSKDANTERNKISILTGAGPWINNTWHGSVYAYKNVKVTQDADIFGVSTASSSIYAHQQVTLHVGSPDAKPIATLTTTSDKGFSAYVFDTVKLNETLPAGTYDLYLKFTSPGTGDQGYNGKSCNFQYFCLYNEGTPSVIPGRSEPR